MEPCTVLATSISLCRRSAPTHRCPGHIAEAGRSEQHGGTGWPGALLEAPLCQVWKVGHRAALPRQATLLRRRLRTGSHPRADAGYVVFTAPDGTEALDRLHTHPTAWSSCSI